MGFQAKKWWTAPAGAPNRRTSAATVTVVALGFSLSGLLTGCTASGDVRVGDYTVRTGAPVASATVTAPASEQLRQVMVSSLTVISQQLAAVSSTPGASARRAEVVKAAQADVATQLLVLGPQRGASAVAVAAGSATPSIAPVSGVAQPVGVAPSGAGASGAAVAASEIEASLRANVANVITGAEVAARFAAPAEAAMYGSLALRLGLLGADLAASSVPVSQPGAATLSAAERQAFAERASKNVHKSAASPGAVTTNADLVTSVNALVAAQYHRAFYWGAAAVRFEGAARQVVVAQEQAALVNAQRWAAVVTALGGKPVAREAAYAFTTMAPVPVDQAAAQRGFTALSEAVLARFVAVVRSAPAAGAASLATATPAASPAAAADGAAGAAGAAKIEAALPGAVRAAALSDALAATGEVAALPVAAPVKISALPGFDVSQAPVCEVCQSGGK